MNWYTQQIDRYREQFLAILGHDLRNPLGSIITSATVLNKAGKLDERQSNAASGILRSATRMSRMVNDLLDLTRTQLGAGIPVNPAFPHATQFLGDYSNIAADPRGGVVAYWTDLRNTVTFAGRTGFGEDAFFALFGGAG